MQVEQPIWRSRAWPSALAVILGLGVTVGVVGLDNPVAAGVVLGATAAVMASMVVWAVPRTPAGRRRYEAELTAWSAGRAAAAERPRIARDLHDIVSHGLGTITVRAAVARRSDGAAGDAERERALADIERASRRATTELRRMLKVLRTAGPAPLRPAESLDDLPEIARRAEMTGLAVELSCEELGDVSAGAQLTIGAVVREALDNAARHAGPTSATVRVSRSDGALVVEIADGGPVDGWRPHPGAGRGLDGLRERLDALGGALTAGRRGHGWSVVAAIPEDS